MKKIKEYKGIIIIIFIIVVIILISKKDTWKGFYYPNGCLSCSENYIYSPELKTKDQCFNWAYDLKEKRNNPEDLFECGRNCKLQDSGMYICKETID